MTDVQTAEKTLTGLRRKREACVTHTLALAEDRQRLSFSAHGDGDVAAQKRLSELNRASTTAALELENIDAAIVEANTRLQAARRAEGIAADQARARELRKVLGDFVECGRKLDAATAVLVDEATEFHQALMRMHSLGCESPTSELVHVNSTLALFTALMRTPWRREFRHLSPGQKRTFAELVAGWAKVIERGIKQRLGAVEVESEAA